MPVTATYTFYPAGQIAVQVRVQKMERRFQWSAEYGPHLHVPASAKNPDADPGYVFSTPKVAVAKDGVFTPSEELVLAASPKLPATSVGELIALAKAKPGNLNYGMTGAGNPLHLTMEMFKTMAGVEIQAVPYKGDAAIFPALITGEIQVAITPMATTLPHVAAGTVRALAVAGAKRSAALPNVPTVAEGGLAGFESSSWQGWFVPANTPRQIVATLQQAARTALAAPDVLERLRITGNEAVGSTPKEFDERFKADLTKFAKIVKDAQISLQD